MPKPQTATNPFYVLLVIVGLVFAITACAYCVLMVNLLNPDRAAAITDEQAGLLGWLNRNGIWLLTAEIALLACFTFGAISTDSYWNPETTNDSAAPHSDS